MYNKIFCLLLAIGLATASISAGEKVRSKKGCKSTSARMSYSEHSDFSKLKAIAKCLRVLICFVYMKFAARRFLNDWNPVYFHKYIIDLCKLVANIFYPLRFYRPITFYYKQVTMMVELCR